MSLHLAAQHLASKGRGPDTQLVHMTKGEVAGLNALAKAHGGSLTINPETGLPEAGFLSSILPMVAGAALAATGVGAPMAAMLVGGGMTLATGSLQKGLLAGLGAYGGAGLGEGLSAAAGTLGNEAASLTPEMLASDTAASQAAATQNAATSLGLPSNAAAGVGNASFVPGGGNTNLADIIGTTSSAPAGPVSTAALSAGAPQVATATPMPVDAGASGSMFGDFGRGIQALGTQQGRDAFIGQAATKTAEATGVGGYGGLAKYGLAALAPSMLQQRQQGATYQDNSPNPYRYRFEWARPSGPNTVNSSEVSQLVGRYTPYADGGLTSTDFTSPSDFAAGGGPGGLNLQALQQQAAHFATGGDTDVARGMSGQSADAMRYLMGQTSQSPSAAAAQRMLQTQPAPTPTPTPVTTGKGKVSGFFGKGITDLMLQSAGLPTSQADSAAAPQYSWNQATHTFTPAPVVQYSQGGISHLGGYSDGGRMLRGPGDGVSDSIPATIGDKQPARLADGEFVVPARIVSELGNGSSEAGARKLYAMMDRVQKARAKTTGKDRVAVNSRADKALPA